MLILKRRAEQRIRLTMTGELKVGETIEIIVVEAHEGRARIGLEADREKVQILRAELILLKRNAQPEIDAAAASK